MPDPRVLVSDKLHPAGLRVLEEAPGLTVDHRPGLDEAALRQAIAGAQALVIRSGSQVTEHVLEAADQLRVIGRAGIGVDNVDVPAASKRGIVVMNAPTGNAVTTAEHALSLLAALARRIPQAHAALRAGRWDRSRHQGVEMAHKTLGIVGLGNIGRIVADRARGLKMRVVGSDPLLTPEKADELGVELLPVDQLFEQADFITIHAPLTSGTRGLVGARAFEQMKPGVRIVNAARGGIIDEAALLQAIESGKVAGAALDVFEQEPLPPDHPLLACDQVICTPHLGASTAEAQERVAVEIATQVVAFLTEGHLQNAVNTVAPPPAVAKQLEPFLHTARRLGRLLGQLPAADAREFRVTARGDRLHTGIHGLAHTALAGYLEHHLGGRINPISAPYRAADRGIAVVEVCEPGGGRYPAAIAVTIQGPQSRHTVTGSVGSNGEALLVEFDDYELDTVLQGTTLLMQNEDRPGVIGAVGTLLGQRGINISRMQVGLKGSAGQALALWNVDSTPPPEVLAELSALENIDSVACVELD